MTTEDSDFACWAREQEAELTNAILDGEPPSWIERTATGFRMRIGGATGAEPQHTPRGRTTP